MDVRTCATSVRTVASVAAGPGAVELATRARLEAAGRAGDALGLAALTLARRIDADIDTGSGLVALVREHAQTLAAAMEGVAPTQDPLDELNARREAKRRSQP